MNDWEIDKENKAVDSVVNILKKKLARFIDHSAEFSNHYKQAEPLSRLCLLGLGSEPLGLMYPQGLKAKIDYYGSLTTQSGNGAKWAQLKEAVEEAELCYSQAGNKTIKGIVIRVGNNLAVITRSDFVESIEDMPLVRLRVGEDTYRMFLVSEYAKAREDCKVPGAF